MDLLVGQFKMVAIASLVLSLAIYVIYYFLLGRKKNYKVKRHALQFVFVFYIMVILASVWSSMVGGDDIRGINLIPFQTVVSVMSTLGMTRGLPMGLAHIVLNICMFIPFGLLLPMIIKKSDSFLKVLGLSFAFTLLIEIVQLVLPMGRSFDIDDLICNTLGGVIGYCIYVLGKWTYGKVTKKKLLIPLKRLLVCLCVLILVIALPLGYYLQYHFSEFGYVWLDYENEPITQNIELEVDLPDTQELMVYKLQSFDEKVLMDELIDKFNVDAEPYYQDHRFYCCNDEEAAKHIAINMESSSWSYDIRDNGKSQNLSDDKKLELAKEYLEFLGLDDDLVLIEYHGDNGECLSFEKLDTADTVYDGNLIVQVNNDSMHYSIRYGIREFKQYKTIEASPKNAIENIKRGKASVICESNEIDKISINKVETEYFFEANKELYIPVYSFKGLAYKGDKEYDIELLVKVIG